MTTEEFEKLCKTTSKGTPMSFRYRDTLIEGTFVGCGEEAIVVEANGKQFVWPRELCSYRKSDYPIPSYS